MRKSSSYRIHVAFLCILFIVNFLISFPIPVSADSSENVSARLYQSEDGYGCSENSRVDSMAYGRTTLGKFSINGKINESATINGVPAFGLESGQLSFDYVCENIPSDSNLTCHIYNDDLTNVDGIELTGSVQQGAILIQSSSDRESWSSPRVVELNYFDSHPNGQNGFYQTKGDDISKGQYYKITIAYATETMIKNTISKLKLNEVKKFFKNAFDRFNIKSMEDMLTIPLINRHVEQYEFYACINSGTFSLHNLSVDSEKLPLEEGVSIEVAKHGETLEEGAVTFSGFQIDSLNANYKLTINGRTVADQSKIYQAGKYTVKAITDFGKSTSRTVYIFGNDDHHGLLYYFNRQLVQGERVSQAGSYPSYAYGAYVLIKSYNSEVPPLYGTIHNKTSGIDIEVNEYASKGYQRPLDIGEYRADFYCGKQTSGELIHYCFQFNVVDQDAVPCVNRSILFNRNQLMDYKAKHYEVAYYTTRGGCIYVCFANENDAFNYAYDIEKRNIEYREDGIYYWSDDTQKPKRKYQIENETDRIQFTKKVNDYARKNVSISYFNANSTFFTSSLNESNKDIYDVLNLDKLELSNLKESIHVFPSEEEREKILSRIPYINNYHYIQEADYDVTEVTAVCKNDGKVFSLKIGTNVNYLLDSSSIYTITEKNKYGKTTEYDVCYMGSNQTVSSWNVRYNNELSHIDIQDAELKNHEITITADQLELRSAVNSLDSEALINISKQQMPDFTCLCSEAAGLTLTEAGEYEIKMIDRVGNIITIHAAITGKESNPSSPRSIEAFRQKLTTLQYH